MPGREPPLSDPRGHDPDPDRAALDELRRAFGFDDGSDAAPDPDATGDATAAAVPDEADQPDEPDEPDQPDEPDVADLPHVADGADVADPVTAPADATPGPRIIRIDDITGSVGPVAPEGAATDVGARGSGATAEHATIDASVPTPDDATAPSVISIAADDLPDALYVAGSLEGDANRSIVFIEDDAAGDVVSPESDRDLRRGIEPRMRERRIAVRRQHSRKRLKWVIAGAVVVLAGIGALAALGSSLFTVQADQVTVTGNVYTDPARLQLVVDDLVGTPTLVVDTEAAERQLETIPWVDDAKVTVDFPHAASIEIRERQAMITYQGPDGRFRVLDREGRVLDVLDEYPFAYVLVTGPDPVDLDPSEFAPEGYAGAAELAKNLTGSVRGLVARLDVTADGSSLVMWLDDGTEVRFGEARDLFTKLVRLETLLALDPEREPGTIDVSTN